MESADGHRVRALKARFAEFVETEVIPAEARYLTERREAAARGTPRR